MKKLIASSLLALAALFSTAAYAAPTSTKVFKTPALAARNIVASKIARSEGSAFHGSWLNAKFVGYSANGKAKQYIVTGQGFRFKQSVLKIQGGWKAYK